MPLFFIVIGAVFLIVAVKGKEATAELLAIMKSDFSGPNNFLVWSLAIVSIAAVGYSSKLKPFSDSFLVLIFVAIILSQKGPTGKDFLSSFYEQIKSTER